MIEFFSGEESLKARVGRRHRCNTEPRAVGKSKARALPFVSFGDSDAMRVGDWVMGRGKPAWQGFSSRRYRVGGRNRALSGTMTDYIQTDARSNRGQFRVGRCLHGR